MQNEAHKWYNYIINDRYWQILHYWEAKQDNPLWTRAECVFHDKETFQIGWICFNADMGWIIPLLNWTTTVGITTSCQMGYCAMTETVPRIRDWWVISDEAHGWHLGYNKEWSYLSRKHTLVSLQTWESLGSFSTQVYCNTIFGNNMNSIETDTVIWQYTDVETIQSMMVLQQQQANGDHNTCNLRGNDDTNTSMTWPYTSSTRIDNRTDRSFHIMKLKRLKVMPSRPA